MRVHWAIYGERNGGHALLCASGESIFANRITQYTDRPGDPPIGINWGPIDSGFYFAEHYVLLRTLPDPTAGRAGMVRSYAAFIEVDHLPMLGNLTAVLYQLPYSLTRPDFLPQPLSISDDDLLPVVQDNVLGLDCIAEKLGATNAVFPLVWALNEPYLPTINVLWGRLPATLRRVFAFSFQFAPEYTLPTKPIVVATLPPLSGRWSAEQLIGKNARPLGNLSTVQSWLAGLATGAAFNAILNDYDIVVKEFSELKLLSLFTDHIARLSELTFAETLKAVRIVEKYSKLKQGSTEQRSVLFRRLCYLVAGANPREISTLRNLDEGVLSDLVIPLQIAMRGWLHDATLSNELITILELAATARSSWWSKPFLSWIENLSILPSDAGAKSVCYLFVSKILTELITPVLANDMSVEIKLITGLPRKLDPVQAENLLRLSEARSWMRLHAASLLRFMSAPDAISIHAAMAGKMTTGFALLHAELGFETMVRVACASGISNLLEYVGRTLHDNVSTLPNVVDTECLHWNLILVHAVNHLTGTLVKPLRTLVVSALDKSDKTTADFASLCKACTAHNVSIWLELTEPADTLNYLESEDRFEVVAKINTYIADLIKAIRQVEFANPGDFGKILNVDVLLKSLASVLPADAARAGVNAFRSIPFLSDQDCRLWLIDLFTCTRHSNLTADDAHLIASILLDNDYPNGAQIVHDTTEKYFRNDAGLISKEIRHKYPMTKQHQPKLSSKNVRIPKVVIATALTLERSEAIKCFGQMEYDTELYADVALWPTNKPEFEIYVLTTGAGNLESQRALLRILRIKPKFAFFVGIGGGVKDNEVGDVIYSTKVHYYESGKEEDDGMKSRPSSEHTSEDLVQLAHRVAEQEWQPTNQPEIGRLPKATPAVIASGEKVMASTSPNAPTFQRIKTAFNDTQIVEMEAYGFLNACRDQKVPHAMIIRGVSDKISDKAESDAKGNQPLAVHNAFAFLIALIHACPNILKPKKRKKFFGLL